MNSSTSLAGGRLIIDLGALARNYRLLCERSGAAKCAAVVKADAYGLGIEPVAKTLSAAGCETFFVALPAEGIELRQYCPNATIYVLNGVHADAAQAMANAGLRPVLNSTEQIGVWSAQVKSKNLTLPTALHIDTGMNRLGLTLDDVRTLASDRDALTGIDLTLVMSHLACAEDHDHPLNAQQLATFQQVRALFPNVPASLSNSAGIFNKPAYLFEMTRPGIALYGGECGNNAENRMENVVTLEGRIVQIRQGKKGETISYGAMQTLTRDTKIATVAVGYADGYLRAGSGAGVPLRDAVPQSAIAHIGEHSVPLLGRITMDLSMFDVTDVPETELEKGWIELIGPRNHIDDVGRAAGTIGYEVLTSLGKRFHRRYVSD